MNVYLAILLAVTALLPMMTACHAAPEQPLTYQQITQSEAWAIMQADPGAIILDARAQDEYAEGHIPGAIVIPHTEVAARAEAELPDKHAVILVYCRSGRRSKIAAEALIELGYTDVREFGGIIDWPYDVVK